MPAGTRTRQAQRRPQAVRREVVPFDEKAAQSQIVRLVEGRREQLLDLLGRDERIVDRFITISLDAITKNRDLLSAEPLSLLAAVRQAAMMGLEPTGVLGDGAIVAYRDDDSGQKIAQFQPMYRGLMRLARNSEDVTAIDAAIRYAKDEFEYSRGTDPKIVHRPSLEDDPGEMLGAYAYAKLRSGELVVRYLPAAKIRRIRDKASRQWQRSGEKSIWGLWPEPMWLKTAVRELAKYLPLTAKAQTALAYDDVVDAIREGVTVRAAEQKQIGDGKPGPRLRARFVPDQEAVDAEKPSENAQEAAGAAKAVPVVSGVGTLTDAPQRAPDEPSEGICRAAHPEHEFTPGVPEDEWICQRPAEHEGPHRGKGDANVWPREPKG